MNLKPNQYTNDTELKAWFTPTENVARKTPSQISCFSHHLGKDRCRRGSTRCHRCRGKLETKEKLYKIGKTGQRRVGLGAKATEQDSNSKVTRKWCRASAKRCEAKARRREWLWTEKRWWTGSLRSGAVVSVRGDGGRSTTVAATGVGAWKPDCKMSVIDQQFAPFD